MFGVNARRLWVGLAALALGFANHSGTVRDAVGHDGFAADDGGARDRLYAELARDVDALEQRLSIIKRVAKLAAPSVVHIEAHKGRRRGVAYGGAPTDVEEAGSGVIVTIDGGAYTLTNRHVIRNADLKDIKIHLQDGRVLNPAKAWSDPGTDVAVMKMPEGRYVAARLGDSHAAEIGDFVVAVGSPFGLSQSITHGIISAKGRHDLDLGEGEVPLQNFLQTDAAINPGNSGGPLLNLRAEVIGLNTAIASSSGGNEGIGFSIPIRAAVQISRQLVKTGRARRAFLGVSLDHKYSMRLASSDGGTQLQGAWVSGITPDSPAADAGMKVGDLILSFDGVRITNHTHLIMVVGLTDATREVEVVASRDGSVRRLRVQLADREKYAEK